MLHIKLKGIRNAEKLSQTFFLQTAPSLTLGLGSKGQISTFSEHGHVANQMKGNHECSNMVANILPADPHAPRSIGHKNPRDGVNRSIFNFLRT